ncbi:MAG: hypothetical protein WCS88_03945 [Patescibacteria group bacterium]|jgi:hypothetical protein
MEGTGTHTATDCTCLDCGRPMDRYTVCRECREAHEDARAPNLCPICSGNGCPSCNYVGETYDGETY